MNGKNSPDREEIIRRMAESKKPLDELRNVDLEAAEDLERLMGLLDDTGREERHNMAEADATRSAPGDDLVDVTLKAVRQRPSAPRRWTGLLVAAALLLFAGLWWMPSKTTPPQNQLLGDSELELLSPNAASSEFGTFEWRGELPEGGWYELYVYGAEDPVTAAPRIASPHLAEERWQPSAEEQALLPDAIEWEVRVLDRSGELIESRRVSASRSSP